MKDYYVRSSSGFTLLEMLVAMAMTAVLAGSLYASLRIGFRAREHSENVLAPVRAAGTAFDIIGRDIQCTPAPRGILAGPFIGLDAKNTTSEGDADSLTFFTRPMSTADAAPGIVGVGYVLVATDDGSGQALVRNVTVNLLAPETPEPSEDILCRYVTSLNLRYLDGTTWLDAWDSTTHDNTLPLAVEVTIEIGGPSDKNAESAIRRFRQVIALPCYIPASTGTVAA